MLEDDITESRARGASVRGIESELASNDVDTYGVVGCRTGHHSRLDSESLSKERDTAPCSHGIVGREHDGREDRTNGIVAEDRFDAVGAKKAIAELEDDDIWVSFRDGDTVYKHQKVDANRWEHQVFDLVKDPGEARNLHDPANLRHREMALALAEYKARLVKNHPQGSGPDRNQLPGEKEAELLRDLGYIR